MDLLLGVIDREPEGIVSDGECEGKGDDNEENVQQLKRTRNKPPRYEQFNQDSDMVNLMPG